MLLSAEGVDAKAPERLTFLPHTLLNTPITRHAPNLAIHHRVPLLVVLRAELLSRHCHPDGIGDTLPKRASGDLDAWELDLGMAGGDGVELGRVVALDGVECPVVVAGKVEHDILEETGVASGEDKA